MIYLSFSTWYMKFIFFWFSLNKNRQLLLPDFSNLPKNEILGNVLGSKIEFKYHSEILFVPWERKNNFLLWKIWRKSSKILSSFEDDDFKDKKSDHYPHSNIIFNLSEDYNNERGHIIALEDKSEVFQNAISTINRFELELNKRLGEFWYAISIYPRTDERNFWNFVVKHENSIQKVTFTYSVPNFLNIKNSLTEDLKDASEETQMTNTSVTLENKNGPLKISRDNKFMKESAEYTTNWAWEFKIKVKWIKAEYSSKKNIKTFTIDELDIEWGNIEQLKKIFDKS